MWGCIVSVVVFWRERSVPSLYVRVYRRPRIFLPLDYRSLIICEGVSAAPSIFVILPLFPHYMWGCIGFYGMKDLTLIVPSLYVRVYHTVNDWKPGWTRSLIICEGVSKSRLFCPRVYSVPSLYVRVYRRGCCRWGEEVSSLIICEGVSFAYRRVRLSELFPHYMWGCIVIRNT